MRLLKHRSVLLAVILAVIPLASCGDDDDSPARPEGNEPPALESPQIIDDVDMNSENRTARAAEALVNATLLAAKAPALTVNAVLAPTASAQWGGDGACWSWTYEYGTCTIIYKVCPTATGFDWTVVLGGTCDGHQYDDWVVLRGETSEDGHSGVVRLYEPNTPVVKLSVAWTQISEELPVLIWSFYEGDVAEENLFGTLTWAWDMRSDTLTWERVGEIKWELTYSQGGDAGSMDIYEWDGGWVLMHEILWNADGTGSWTSTTGQGSSTETW